MEYILIKKDTTEWEYMWNWLANHPLNKGLEYPEYAENNGEMWQYMGSFKQKDKVIHELRHRQHPTTGTRQYLKLEASNDMNDTMIQNKNEVN